MEEVSVPAGIEKIIERMRVSNKNVRFEELKKVCDFFFEKRPSRGGGSHETYRTPWPGNPRVNIQNKGGKAKPYQVKQVLEAIDMFNNLGLSPRNSHGH
ncbi:MAG: toxin HicA [Corynebacterium sp.]|uniref:toxin HicA n=1 Tax=Corynebacterium sp. TaxID=1720 RepID=UPI0026DCADFA|nr:toxin HicA [Corynebacterium sp.]MDO5099646.1 toxin HicA [Corynebacterium sp.]